MTIAFESLVSVLGAVGDAVTFAADATKAAGEGLAAIFVGSDDPIIRNLNNIRELREELERLEGGGSTRTFFTEVGGIDLTGSRDEQIQQLRERLAFEQRIELQLGREERARQEANAALEAAKKAAQEYADSLEDTPSVASVVIDQDLVDKAKASFASLGDEVRVLGQTYTDLQELGAEGIGLAEDFEETRTIMQQLQGQTGITAAEVRFLINEKRRLQEAIDDVTASIQDQEAAAQFLTELNMETTDLAAKFEAIRAGGSPVEVEALLQARDIYQDLGASTGETVTSIQQALLAQQAWNAALEALDPSGLGETRTFIEVLKAELATLEEGSDAFNNVSNAITALGESAIDATLSDLGLGTLIDFTPIEQQFAEGERRLREAFNLAGIVNPDEDPRFEAALESLKNKLTGLDEFTSEIGKSVAQNLQQSFSDFLFDPFEDGLDGMVRSFGETLRRLAADLLAQQLLMSFFSSFANSGGGVGAIANAAIGALSGGTRADGGPVSAGQSYLVGERGPEIITPRQSGSVIPNEMMNMQQAAPQVNVAPAPVVVVDDPSKVSKALASADGQRALVDTIASKKNAINQALA